MVQGRDLLRQGGIAVGEGLRGQSDDLLAQGAHLDKLAVELGQLFIELTTLGVENMVSASPYSTSSPSRKKAVRSEIRSACCILWVTMTMV